MAKKHRNTGKKLFESLDDVQAMPEGFYSGDQPNSNLRRFIEEHATPYVPEHDEYKAHAFTKAITTTKATAIYNMHTYWSKKPHDAIRQYIRHYTQPGDVVMDPFSGSGGTSLAALMENRKAVAIDRSPAATFITKNQCFPISPESLEEAFSQLNSLVKKDIDWLYGTRCDRCGGKAISGNVVHSQIFQCPRCLAKVPLFDCVEVDTETAKGKPKKANACPTCFAKGKTEIIRSQSQKFGYMPVLVSYMCISGCKPARSERRHNDTDPQKRKFFKDCDLKRIEEIEASTIPYWYPQGFDMSGFSRYQRDALFYYGVKEVADLFTKRNRWALAAIRDKCMRVADPALRDYLLFTLQSVLLTGSILQQYREAGGGFAKGTYYVPQVSLEREVLSCLVRKEEHILKGVRELQGLPSRDLLVTTQSSCSLSAIPSSSIDYIFTDPPYAEKVQYGELNYVWEAWLDFDTTWHSEEIIVNDVRGKTEFDWSAMMTKAMAECYRVLKPGRWLSLCYHDTSEGTWELVQDIMAEVGFIVDKTDSALFIDAGQKSYNQLTSDKSTKRDLVLNFRKPKPLPFKVTKVYGLEDADKLPKGGDIATFGETARQMVRDYLVRHPGSTKDRIYDELVSRLVASRSMEAHDFESLLRSVADEVQQPVKEDLFRNKEPDLWGSHVQGRWYLKETADQVDHAEQAKEDASARRLEKFIGDYLKKRPDAEGVHYSDLFEQYLPVHDKPRRLLNDWLPEFFIKTASGTWRLPDEEESQVLAKLREAGTLRRIKRFANALIDGVPVRDKDRPGSDVDLLDWLRQCRRAGLYEQGRAIYEKGGLNSANLTDEQQIEAEDDYRICVRRGSSEEAKPKRKSPKKQGGDK
jgi:DNA modification methylase